MNSKHNLTDAELNQPLYVETEERFIPYEEANATFQNLVQKHKSLGVKRNHDVRRLALALARRLDRDGRAPDSWEMALMEDAGLRRGELPRLPAMDIKVLRIVEEN